MQHLLSKLHPVIFLLAGIDAAGIGKAWRVLPYKNDYWNHPSWSHLGTSAFEVRTISGVGRLVPYEDTEKLDKASFNNEDDLTKEYLQNENPESVDRFDDSNHEIDDHENPNNEADTEHTIKILRSENSDSDSMQNRKSLSQPRVRREAENETKMEKISTTKTVRDVRLSSPETWSSSQPISVEFRHRASLDQMIQAAGDHEDDSASVRSHYAPRADFVTSHHRRSYEENREPRDMIPVTRRSYDDFDSPWHRNAIRERDYEHPAYRRGYFSYYYPDRYRMDREYYTRSPSNDQYYYDRYRDDDMDVYGRSRQSTTKPKRIIYYATLPEIVRKPVDLRNYPRTYDGTRSPVSRDGTYKRVPGNVDPSRYRYRNLYDGYDSYSKRSSYFDRPYGYPEEDSRRKVSLAESLRNGDAYEQTERKLSNQIAVRNDGKLPWPVQVGTEVSVKDEERGTGRKVFGENNGFERFQSAQLQKAPDATGSSELQSDN